MKGFYKIKVKGKLKEYEYYDDIPHEFDHLICFKPDYPPSPHSEEDHKLIHTFGKKFDKLMEREYASSN